MNNAPDGKNRRVLIIDDNRAIHDDFRKILSPSAATAAMAELDATAEALFGRSLDTVQQTQFEVDSAYQGQEGVQLVKKALEAGRPYAMAFVDVRMPPGWDGVETTQKIWELDPDLQVVLCTAYSDYSWDEMFARLGRRDGLLVLKKPFDAVEAIQLAQALTEKWWLHQVSRQKVEDLESRVAERTRELRWKTAFLEAQVNCSIDGLLVVDAQGKKLLQNQRLTDLLKIPQAIADDEDDRDQVAWVTHMARDPAWFIARVLHLYAHPNETGRDEFEMKNGTVIDRYSAPVTGKDGEYYGRIWLLRDITERARAVEALRESDEKFRQLADNITDVFWICAPDFQTMHYISVGYQKIWGRSPESLFANPHQWIEAILPEDRERVWAVFATLRENTPEVSAEYRIARPDGAVRWVHDRGFQVRDAAGQLVRLTGIATDITERKQNEEALRLLGSAVEQSKESIVITDAELDLPGPRIVFVNPAFTQMTGYTGEEAVGKTPRILQGPRTDKAVLSRLRQTLERGDVFTGETINYRKNGEEFNLDWQIAPIRDTNGKITHFVAIQRDTTERKLAENVLRESDERFHHLADNISDVFWITSPDMQQVHYVSPAFERIWGSSAESLYTHPEEWAEAIPVEDREQVLAAFARLGSTESSMSVEFRVVHPDGTVRWMVCRGFQVRDAAGRLIRLTGITSDITERKRADETVKRLAAIVEYADEAIISKTLDGLITSWNPAAERMFGYTAAEIIGQPLQVLVPADRAQEEAEIVASIAGGAPVRYVETVQIRKGGQRFDVSATVSALKDPAGKVIGASRIVRDITERQRAEKALRESDEKFRQLVDSITDAFWIRSPDMRELHYLSPGFERIWGRSLEHFQAEPQNWMERILPEDRERVVAVFATLTADTPSVDVEYRIVRPDGEFRWIRVRGFQVRDAAGQLIRLTGTISDITERHEAEEELFQSRETLRGILDHIPQRVFWKDRDLVYRGCNHAFAVDMGFDGPPEVIGKTDFEANWKAMAEIYRANDRSVIDLDTAKRSFEEPAVSRDGRPMWIRTSKIPLHDRQGRVTGVLGTYEDITEHKLAALEIESLNVDLERRVEQRTGELLVATQGAEHANHAKSEFLSRTSHELRTPLNSILGFGQLLEMEKDLDREARESIEQLLRAARHLLALIDSVLDISDAESDRVMLSTEPVAVDRLVEETLCLIQPLAAAFQIDLEQPSFPEHHWAVLGDATRLKKALFHLLSNAVKYNRPGGTIVFTCALAAATDPPAIRFCVKDTGPGISAENFPRLFAPFDRLDIERTRAHVTGTGLGLAFSKRMVELMGGRIGVESTLGVGSTFWIEMPLAESSGSPCGQMTLAAGGNPHAKAPGSKTLLYIEDNLSNLRLITRMVARRPAIHLRSAATGALGLEMAREHRPDLILLNLHPSDSHGVELLAELRADPRTSEIPVALLAADQPGKREQMRDAGARVFLAKPVEVRTLLGALDQFIKFQPEEAG